MLRRPAVAGSFYPSDPKRLLEEISNSFARAGFPGIPKPADKPADRVVGLLSPHAGYPYSGWVAASGYKRLADDGSFDSVVILGPNHWGIGHPVAVYSSGSWLTPLGVIDVDEELAKAIAAESNLVAEDGLAHSREHSIEVQLPFLQAIYGEFSLVPISMFDQSLDTAVSLGEVIADCVRELGRSTVVIASSDMSHYVTDDAARENDLYVLRAAEELDPEEMYRRIEERGVSMCGPGPAAVMMTAARELGGSRGRLLSYHTSGEVTGDYISVVGYASLVVER